MKVINFFYNSKIYIYIYIYIRTKICFYLYICTKTNLMFPQLGRNDEYNFVRAWEARERERERLPRLISLHTRNISRSVGLLKFYEEATSL